MNFSLWISPAALWTHLYFGLPRCPVAMSSRFLWDAWNNPSFCSYSEWRLENFTWCPIITLCAPLLCYSWLYRALLYLPSHPQLRVFRNSSDGSSCITSTTPDILLYPFWDGWGGRIAHSIQRCNYIFYLFFLLCRFTQENGSFSHANTMGHHCCLPLEERVPVWRSHLVRCG